MSLSSLNDVSGLHVRKVGQHDCHYILQYVGYTPTQTFTSCFHSESYIIQTSKSISTTGQFVMVYRVYVEAPMNADMKVLYKNAND